MLWCFPVSKTDVAAKGEATTWGCLCSREARVGMDGLQVPCPYHMMLDYCEWRKGFPTSSPYFFITQSGLQISKAQVVEVLQDVVGRLGLPTRDAHGRVLYTGHAMRVGSAQYLSGVLGFDTLTVQAIARLSTQITLHYVRAAPLQSMTARCKVLLDSLGETKTLGSIKDAVHLLHQQAVSRLEEMLAQYIPSM